MTEAVTKSKTRRLTLVRRRSVWLPTVWGWLLILIALGVLGLNCIQNLYGFLAPVRPIKADILVVEGWVPGYTLDEAYAEFQTGSYAYLAVTGGEIEWVYAHQSISSYASRCATYLHSKGIPEDRLILSVTAPTLKDRTYTSSRTLREVLRDKGLTSKRLNLLTLGPHARRSWRLFEKGLGPDYSVGVISCPPRGYDTNRWWTTSSGVRQVSAEAFAYAYVLFVMPFLSGF